MLTLVTRRGLLGTSAGVATALAIPELAAAHSFDFEIYLTCCSFKITTRPSDLPNSPHR